MQRIKIVFILAAMMLLGGQTTAPIGPTYSVLSQFISGIPSPLGSLQGANFNSTADQAISIPKSIKAFQITSIIVTNCNGQLSNAVGGFYQLAGKSGQPIVSAAQTYFLSPGSGILTVPLASGMGATRLSLSTIYLSLTTAQGSALTCDVYVFGVDLT